MNISIANSIDDRQLELIILPTEKCNFRCSYCYEDFEQGGMKDQVSDSVIKLINSRISSLKKLHLSWFGGEPLLAQKVIEKISVNVLKLTEAYDLNYSASMTTNGYLLSPHILLWAMNLGIKDFQITLDGDENTHNLTRLRADKEGTFSTIWNNLILAKQLNLNFNIVIRVHFNPKTFENTKKFVEVLEKELLYDKRFSVHFHAISRLGGSNDSDIDIYDSKEEKERATNELYRLLNKNVRKCEPNSAYVCYAAKLNSFVIRSDGRLAKCTVAFHDDINNIGKLKSDGTISLDMDKVRKWALPVFQGNTIGAACPYSVISTRNNQITKIPTISL